MPARDRWEPEIMRGLGANVGTTITALLAARFAASRPVWAVAYVIGAFIVLPLVGFGLAR